MSVWTEEETAEMRRMWLGGVPPKEIAKRIGRTYNAVVGRANRLALPLISEIERTHEPVPFDELDLVPLPKTQRIVLGALLSSHPNGVTCVRLSQLLQRSEDNAVNLMNRAVRTVEGLRRKLKLIGWDCRVRGDRSGYRIVRHGADEAAPTGRDTFAYQFGQHDLTQ